MKRFFLFFLISFCFVGCQTPPTEIHEKSEITISQKDEAADLFAANTVILDVRPAFEYLLSHVSGSANIQPQDFYQKKKKYENLPDPDYEGLARRLALKGVSPEKKIIILGKNLDDSEAKMKWLLEFLGVKKVQIRNYKNIEQSKTRIIFRSDREEIENAPNWKPVIDEKMLAQKLN